MRQERIAKRVSPRRKGGGDPSWVPIPVRPESTQKALERSQELLRKIDKSVRRFERRAPTRHPGHVDAVIVDEVKASFDAGAGPLDLGGPVLDVDTSGPVDIDAVAAWVRASREVV